jgi:predicted transcriptional regulator
MGRVRELAMPKTSTGISSAKLARAKSMLKNGYSQQDVADMLDISRSKLEYALKND